MVKVAHFDTTG